MMPSPNQDAMSRFRAKYPQYSATDDSTLAARVIEKFPQYSEAFRPYLTSDKNVAQEPVETPGPTPAPVPRPAPDRSKDSGASFGTMFIRDLAKRLSTPEGYLSISEGALQGAAAPFTAADQALRAAPEASRQVSEHLPPLQRAIARLVAGKSTPVADVVAAPFGAIAEGTGLAEHIIGQGLDAVGMSRKTQNLGLDPDRAASLRDQISRINAGAAQFVVPMAAHKAGATLLDRALSMRESPPSSRIAGERPGVAPQPSPEAISPIVQANQTLSDAGMVPIGKMQTKQAGELVLFNHPETGSTLAMKVGEVTPESVQAKIAEHKAKYETSEVPPESVTPLETPIPAIEDRPVVTPRSEIESGISEQMRSAQAPQIEPRSIPTFPPEVVDRMNRGEVAKPEPAAVSQPVSPAPSGPKAEGEYPRAGKVVDGRTVRNDVPNTSSISASLTDYEELPGIREVPMSDFELTGKTYDSAGNSRIKQLASQISESKEITPLIVVVDAEGSYILEGAHRADALYNLGAKSFPATVVIDKSNPPKAARVSPPVSPKAEGEKLAETPGRLPESFDNTPPEVATKVKDEAENMASELAQAKAVGLSPIRRAGIEDPYQSQEVVGHMKGGQYNDFPEWFSDVAKPKKQILKTLDEIVKDDPKTALSKELKDIIDRNLSEGRQANQGDIPPDESYLAAKAAAEPKSADEIFARMKPGEQSNMFKGRNDPGYQAKVPSGPKQRATIGTEGTPLFEKQKPPSTQEEIPPPKLKEEGQEKSALKEQYGKKEEPPQWKYEEYSDWSRRLAKNYTRAELEAKLGKTEGAREGLANSHRRAVEKTTSMTSQSQRRAQSRNAMTGNYEENQALKNALEIHDNYPEKAKGKKEEARKTGTGGKPLAAASSALLARSILNQNKDEKPKLSKQAMQALSQ